MISLKQIQYALAVGEHLHFKKAADHCHVSQSTLSSAINEMESQLGLTLFERNNKQVLLTEMGRQVLERARKIKLDVDEIHQLADNSLAPLSTPMTLGIIPTIGPYLLPIVLPEVRKQYPQFRLRIVEAMSHELLNKVKNGELDAAILALPFPLEGLLSFEFWQEDFYWVSHKDDCPKQANEITTRELELDKLMLLKEGHCLTDHALAACQLKDLEQRAEFDSTSLHTLIHMVAGKLGTTLVPEMALQQLLSASNELKAIHLNEPGPHRTISFIVRPSFVKTNDVIQLKQLFNRQLSSSRICPI